MDTLANRLAALSPEQRRLLERRLDQQGGAAPPPAPLRADPAAPATLPLAFAQQIMWTLAQRWPAAAVCNDPVTFHFQGPFAFAALERS